MKNLKIEFAVGCFILLGLIASVFLILNVTNINNLKSLQTYRLYATFENIGSLKLQSPVKVGGVVIGRVVSIDLNPQSYLPVVGLDIKSEFNKIPDTSSLSIRTAGLLGEQFLALNIGFEDPEMGTKILKEGDMIKDTKSALVLEDLIGQFLYRSSGNDEQKESKANGSPVSP